MVFPEIMSANRERAQPNPEINNRHREFEIFGWGEGSSSSAHPGSPGFNLVFELGFVCGPANQSQRGDIAFSQAALYMVFPEIMSADRERAQPNPEIYNRHREFEIFGWGEGSSSAAHPGSPGFNHVFELGFVCGPANQSQRGDIAFSQAALYMVFPEIMSAVRERAQPNPETNNRHREFEIFGWGEGLLGKSV